MNTIIAIGWTGSYVCYLNLTREEAIRRYKAPENSDSRLWATAEEFDNALENGEVYINEVVFDDTFSAYAIYDYTPTAPASTSHT